MWKRNPVLTKWVQNQGDVVVGHTHQLYFSFTPLTLSHAHSLSLSFCLCLCSRWLLMLKWMTASFFGIRQVSLSFISHFTPKERPVSFSIDGGMVMVENMFLRNVSFCQLSFVEEGGCLTMPLVASHKSCHVSRRNTHKGRPCIRGLCLRGQSPSCSTSTHVDVFP